MEICNSRTLQLPRQMMIRRRETAIVLSTGRGEQVSTNSRQEMVLLFISRVILIVEILKSFHSLWYIATGPSR